MGLMESFYYQAPVPIQNLLVSAMGVQLYRQRYGKAWHEQMSTLQKSESFSSSEVMQYQLKEVGRLLEFSIKNVPFYRDIGRVPAIKNYADWESIRDNIPIIDKSILRETPERFVASSATAPGKRFSLSTSGTSGTPLKIVSTFNARQRHYAFWSRLRHWYGVGASDIRATFFGRIIMRSDENSPPFWRYDFPQKNMLFSSYHMNDENLKAYYDQLVKLAPAEIIGYPSSLAILSSFINRNSLPPLRPKVVFATAETLLDNQRSEIQAAIHAPLVNQYGCTEMVVFAAECHHGTMHVHPEHGLLEVVDGEGRSLSYGETGEAVCTGLLNFAMPLIRYKLGDRISLSDEPCRCGSNFPVISSIEGRVDDLLITPSGRPIPRLDPIFKGMRRIRETQIVQTAPGTVVIRLCADDSFTLAEEKNLLAEAVKRIGPEINIRIERLDKIPRQANGKFRSVIRMPFDKSGNI